MIEFFKLLVFKFYKFWVHIIFLFNRILQILCNPQLVRNFSCFLLSFLSSACISNRLSILDTYWFIEKLTSHFSVHRICSQSVWLKSEINLLLSNFLQSCFNISDLTAGFFKEKSFNKINCGRWSENVDVTLPDSISSKEVEFQKMLSINEEVLEILYVGVYEST